MKPLPAYAVVLALALSAGCGRDRNRAVPAPAPASAPAPAEEEKDYTQMIERLRNRRETEDAAKIRELQNAIEQFQFRIGRSPTNLNELVRARLIPAIPEPPKGTAFHLDAPRGNVILMRDGLPPELAPRPPDAITAPSLSEPLPADGPLTPP